MDEVERLRRRVAEVEALVETLTRTVEQQARVIPQQTQTIEKLTAALEEARRAGKRQAAPFRQGPPQSEPKRPSHLRSVPTHTHRPSKPQNHKPIKLS